jgi:hypothetical protein
MDCVGYQEPEYEGTNERTGRSYYRHFCEGCGYSKVIPDDVGFDSSSPIFWSDKNGGCGCTKRRELTDHHDSCDKCKGPIYLTPGAAMYKKFAESYVRKKEYCDTCLDEVVVSAPCRNAGCKSIGGGGLVEATFGDQLFYAEKQLTFPPNNCEVCRTAIKIFKKRQEVRPNCRLCRKPFRVTYGVMIMILKNEERYEIPKECLRCRGFSPEERRRMERESELREMSRQRLREVSKVLKGDKDELQRELARHVASKQIKKHELLRMLNHKNKLQRRDVRELLQKAVEDQSLMKILVNPNDVGYRRVRDALAHVTGGKGKMTEKELAVLPEAFRTVLKDHPNAMGLFKKAPSERAPGMSPVNQHYEVLSAAALKMKEVRTTSNKSLAIYNTDRVDFGIKMAKGHAQPKRYGTIEADILIHRPADPLGLTEKVIGVDAKYTKGVNKKYEIISQNHLNDFRRQLDGVRNNLNNGNLNEYHFVTNKEFGDTFKGEVEKTNLQMVKDYLGRHNEQFHSGDAARDLNYLTAEEKASMPDRLVDPRELGGLSEYSDAVRQFADRYNINQIEISEHVKYTGT